jgi:hypothetical protein
MVGVGGLRCEAEQGFIGKNAAACWTPLAELNTPIRRRLIAVDKENTTVSVCLALWAKDSNEGTQSARPITAPA